MNQYQLGKWTLVTLIAGFFAIANPAVVACSSADETEEISFEEADMRAAVKGRYAGVSDGHSISVAVDQDKDHASELRARVPLLDAINQTRQRSLFCGGHSFVKSAGACITTSSMSIKATIISDSPLLASGDVTGMFVVFGNSLTSGYLSLSLPGERTLEADFEAGVVKDWRLNEGNGDHALELSPTE